MKRKLTTAYISIEDLSFDPVNPRLPRRLIDANQATLLAWLLNETSLIDLIDSIGSQGFLPGEPLLVTSSPNKTSEYVVVEGNRRLAACLLLLSPEEAPVLQRLVSNASEAAAFRPKQIPVVTFPSRSDVLEYVGFRHITGTREWTPLAKARFLDERFKSLTGTNADRLRDLARRVGTRDTHVAQMLTGLAIHDTIVDADFFGHQGLSERVMEFTVLSSILNHENILRFLGLTSSTDPSLAGLFPEALAELTSWLFVLRNGRTALGAAWNVPNLDRVLADTEAIAKLREGATVDEALQDAGEGPLEQLGHPLTIAHQQLLRAADLLQRGADVEENNVDQIHELRKLVRTLQKSIENKLEDDSELTD